MAAIIPSMQIAANPPIWARTSVIKSCQQSSRTVICTSSQLHRLGRVGSFIKGSHGIKVGRRYLDTRKRFKGKWGLKATAFAEDGERVLSAKEKYLQAIYGASQEPKSENGDMLSGFKDMFKGFINSGGSGESSVKSDPVTSAAGNEYTGDAVLSAQERSHQIFGAGGENQPKSEITDVDVLGGLKDAQNAATESVKNLFKGVTGSVDSMKDNVGKSAPEDGSAGKATLNVKESLGNFFQGITDTVDSVNNSSKESVVKSASEYGSAGEAATNADDSVSNFLQSITGVVDSAGSLVPDSLSKSSAEDGSAGKALSSAQQSVNKFVDAVTEGVEAAGSSVTGKAVNSAIEDGSTGDILSSGIDSVDNFSNITKAVEPAGGSVSASAVTSATEAGISRDTLSTAEESVNKIVQGITDSIQSAGSSATDSVVKSATENGSTGGTVLSAQEKYLQSIQGGLKQSDNNDLFNGLKGADVDVLSGLKDAQDAVANSVNSLVKSITGSFDAAGNAVKDTYENFNGSVVRLFKSATGSVETSLSGIRPNIDGFKAPKISVDVDLTAPFRVGTPVNDALKEVVIVVKDVTGKALVTAGDLITKFYSSAKDSIPEDTLKFLNDIEDKVSQVAQPFAEAVNQTYAVIVEAEKAIGINPEIPVVPVILVIGGTLFISVSWFQSKYGGYSGDLQPTEALDLLKKEGNVVLVDIRPQELRDTEGIPDLRRSTRFKFAAVEVLKANKTIRGQLKNANEIDSLLTAAVIRNLKNVDGGTKIIVLDEDGSQSKRIARGLRKSGTKRAYRVEGGYKGWAKQGLRSRMDAPQSPLTILKEETEAFVEEVKPTVAGVVGVSVGLFAATYALLEWEKTLQLIGIVGLAATIYLRAESYESVEDFKADIRLLQKPFKSLIQGILVLTGQAEKRELQLATAPASSAVQGRMLQAAAKHGAASEKEQAELPSNVTEISDDEMASAVDDSELAQSHSASVSNQEPPQ